MRTYRAMTKPVHRQRQRQSATSEKSKSQKEKKRAAVIWNIVAQPESLFRTATKLNNKSKKQEDLRTNEETQERRLKKSIFMLMYTLKFIVFFC